MHTTRNLLNFESLLKGTLPGLIQFLATGNRVKMKKNAFYCTLKALFFHKDI